MSNVRKMHTSGDLDSSCGMSRAARRKRNHEERRFQHLAAKISQKYDSQMDGYHKISERSLEETDGANNDSRRHLTIQSGSSKHNKDSQIAEHATTSDNMKVQ